MTSVDLLNRRAFLGRVALGTAALCGAPIARAAESARRPNILVILTDDQGWGDIHSHGNDTIVTPVLDRLASEGARFDRFYVSPVCAPTRAAFLTGRYYLRTGVDGVTHREEVMRSEERTLAEVLKDAGYATGCFGKWHNGAQYPNHPNGQGFDEFFGFCAGHWNNYFDTTLERNGNPVETKGYINDVVTDAALDFIDAHADAPFFCYVPYNTPHSPFQVPDRYFDPFKEQGLDDTLACVYGMVKSIDDNVGRLLDRLESHGLADDTIVVFFGDNGPNSERYNGGMLGRKGSVHEGGVRNALFMRWPGHIPPGTEVKPIAAAIDLLPTLAELADVPVRSTGVPARERGALSNDANVDATTTQRSANPQSPFEAGKSEGTTETSGTPVTTYSSTPGFEAHGASGVDTNSPDNIRGLVSAVSGVPAVPETTASSARPLDGLSLAPLLTGEPVDWPDRMLFSHWKGRGAVRTQQYRLVIERDRHTLFDMHADPGQTTDITESHPDVAAKLRAAYDRWYDEMMREAGGPIPIPIGYEQMPVVTLPAPDAQLHGGVTFAGDKGWANDWITNWTSPEDHVTWDIDIVRAGTYTFALLFTSPESALGTEVALEIDYQRDHATPTPSAPLPPDSSLRTPIVTKRLTKVLTAPHHSSFITPHFPRPPIPSPDRVERNEVYEMHWAELPMGQLELAPGRATLTVRATKIAGEMAIDLKAVRVERVG
ncbi:MAG: hypothetical protein AMXMBFR82_38560 [Candidatus Hydrogenedentota bacterium]